MLRKRVITALWGIPLLTAAVWLEQPLPWFTMLVAIWGLLAAFEFYQLVKTAQKAAPLAYFGMVWSLLSILSQDASLLALVERHTGWLVFIGPFAFFNLLNILIFTSAVIISFTWLISQTRRERAFTSWAWTMAGILYVGWLLSYLVALRGLDNGRNWGFLALFTTFASDTAAFFVGRALGSHKLAPRISPGKTWEGAIGGVLSAIIVSLFFMLPTPLTLHLNWGQAAFLGLLVSIFGQLGDLLESLFKRKMGAKDSGRLLPGHGGVLDRMDSIVFAGMVVYYYAIWVA